MPLVQDTNVVIRLTFNIHFGQNIALYWLWLTSTALVGVELCWVCSLYNLCSSTHVVALLSLWCPHVTALDSGQWLWFLTRWWGEGPRGCHSFFCQLLLLLFLNFDCLLTPLNIPKLSDQLWGKVIPSDVGQGNLGKMLLHSSCSSHFLLLLIFNSWVLGWSHYPLSWLKGTMSLHKVTNCHVITWGYTLSFRASSWIFIILTTRDAGYKKLCHIHSMCTLWTSSHTVFFILQDGWFCRRRISSQHRYPTLPLDEFACWWLPSDVTLDAFQNSCGC